jgi:uncharacterized membrane protein YeaQ/YmgE (transglycosylase-associated protein family)
MERDARPGGILASIAGVIGVLIHNFVSSAFEETINAKTTYLVPAAEEEMARRSIVRGINFGG